MQMILASLKMPKSSYYYQKNHPGIDRHSDVKPLIKEIFSRTPNGVGYRQVAMALKNEAGISMSGKTVLKCMRELNLHCKIRSKKYNSYVGKVGKIAPNLLNRNFVSNVPLEKLVTDITEFKVADEKAYLSPIMDLYNNEIIAFDVSRHPNMNQINNMLAQIENQKFSESAMLHSDQGWQYQQRSYQCKLKQLGIRQSMSRKATCLDNACMEGFFGHLKDEFYRNRDFKSFEQFKEELEEYIRYWNTKRYQMCLNGMTPVQYRSHPIRAA